MQFCFIVAHRLFIVMKCKYAFGGRYTYEDILGGKIQNTAQAVDQYSTKEQDTITEHYTLEKNSGGHVVQPSTQSRSDWIKLLRAFSDSFKCMFPNILQINAYKLYFTNLQVIWIVSQPNTRFQQVKCKQEVSFELFEFCTEFSFQIPAK